MILLPGGAQMFGRKFAEISCAAMLILATPSLAAAAKSEKYLACEIEGLRFNIEESYGLLRSQLGMALSGQGRDEVMGYMIELIAATRR